MDTLEEMSQIAELTFILLVSALVLKMNEGYISNYPLSIMWKREMHAVCCCFCFSREEKKIGVIHSVC